MVLFRCFFVFIVFFGCPSQSLCMASVLQLLLLLLLPVHFMLCWLCINVSQVERNELEINVCG